MESEEKIVHETIIPMVEFQDGIAHLFILMEELRQQIMTATKVDAETCCQWRDPMEHLLHTLWMLPPPTNDVEHDLRKHIHQKVGSLLMFLLETCCHQKKEVQQEEDFHPDVERECQAAIARMAEVNLLLLLHQQQDQQQQNDETDDNDYNGNVSRQKIIDMYVSYQKSVLRQRAKPAIARLVKRRQLPNPYWTINLHDYPDDDGVVFDEEASKSQHSHVLTVILGQASALIHPLLLWRQSLPSDLPLREMCTKAIQVLDEQAQTLVQTIATWFLEDRKVEEWMTKSAQQLHDEAPPSKANLGELDALVEDLAFGCQLMARYAALISSGADDDQQSTTTILSQQIQPEWNWKYATLERYLTTQQFQSALLHASPVVIVLGTSIQVPSVVEDAQYLSTRALERAASTQSAQAIGTVAHSIANNVWSTDITGGVHHALMEQKGCWQDPASEDHRQQNAMSPKSPARTPPGQPKSGNFAAALLDALDDDLSSSAISASTKGATSSKLPSAPSSGSFLGSLSLGLGNSTSDKLQQIRLDTHLCSLNGFYSASMACSSLVKVLDSLLQPQEGEEETTSQQEQESKALTAMIELAREELFRFAESYRQMLQFQVERVVSEWCGSVQDASVYKGNLCIPVLRYYLERESYDLNDAAALRAAEDDARLDQQYIQPLRDSRLLQQLKKCDAEVVGFLTEQVSQSLVELWLDCLLSTTVPKRFTDWGSLLLSKQVRLVQQFISHAAEQATSDLAKTPAPITKAASRWERLTQVVTVLQLEKPSDWSYYAASSILTPTELQSILNLRIDFSREAIAAVVASVTSKAAGPSIETIGK